jgi:hypothetical protein
MDSRQLKSRRFDDPWVTSFEVRPDLRLLLHFSDGAAGVADLTWLVQHDCFFKTFAEQPDRFLKVHRSCRGRVLHWDRDRELDASVLYRMVLGFDPPLWQRINQEYQQRISADSAK